MKVKQWLVVLLSVLAVLVIALAVWAYMEINDGGKYYNRMAFVAGEGDDVIADHYFSTLACLQRNKESCDNLKVAWSYIDCGSPGKRPCEEDKVGDDTFKAYRTFLKVGCEARSEEERTCAILPDLIKLRPKVEARQKRECRKGPSAFCVDLTAAAGLLNSDFRKADLPLTN